MTHFGARLSVRSPPLSEQAVAVQSTAALTVSISHDKQVHRFAKTINEFDPITHTTLMGSLLIEEVLSWIITKFVFHPEQIEEARLRSSSRDREISCLSTSRRTRCGT